MMKKEIVLLTALALAVGFTGCQRERYDLDGNSNVKEVNTRFVFNIAPASPQTKQTQGAATQSTGFRGIKEARLLAYAEGDAKDGKILAADKTAQKMYDLSNAATAGSVSSELSRRVLEMSLPLQTNILLFYGRGESGSVGSGSSVKVYDRYGKLDKYEIGQAEGSANFQLGKRLQKADENNFYTMEKLMAGIITVIMNTTVQGEDHISITANGYPAGTATTNTYRFAVDATDYPTVLKWEDYAKESGYSPVAYVEVDALDANNQPIKKKEYTVGRYPLEEKLYTLYSQMTTIRKGATDADEELRAGTGEATLRIIQDLWTVINSIRWAEPINQAEAVAKYFAQKVHEHLTDYFSGTVQADGKPVTGVTFNALNGTYGINTKIVGDLWPEGVTSEQKPGSTELKGIEEMTLAEFPFNFNLPRGAAYMRYNISGKYFYYPKTFNTSATGGTPEQTSSGGYGATNYYYPAEILYYANSPVRASDLDHTTNDYPDGVSNWADDANWPDKVPVTGTTYDEDAPETYKYDWHYSHVISTTRSVAMKYDINYGVAMLETRVGYKFDADATGYIYDNNHAVQKMINPSLAESAEPDKKIAVTGTSFKLTGIIIGGQPQNVGWDFLPIPDESTAVAAVGSPGDEGYQAAVPAKVVYGFVYDKDVDINIPASGASETPAYTVVFDNYKSEGDQDKVYVALEFQNNTGMDIFGNFNMIRNGGYFYLIGELDPAKAKEISSGVTINWPASGHVIPPYVTTEDENYGKSKEIPRIFIQDRKTTVTFRIGARSLHYAYVTVPDLRASSMTMGLSVDLEWGQGLQYDDVVVGGN